MYSVLYVDHVTSGMDLFRVICERDMEGVVAKQASAKYTPEATTWVPGGQECGSRHPRAANHAARGSGNSRCVKFGRAHLAQTFTENAPNPQLSRHPTNSTNR